MSVLVLKADDWEGLFIDGKLIDEGHSLEEGSDRIKYFQEASKSHDFDIMDVKIKWLEDKDEEELMSSGSFPDTLKELKGNY